MVDKEEVRWERRGKKERKRPIRITYRSGGGQIKKKGGTERGGIGNVHS